MGNTNDSRILLSQEEAERKADEKKRAIGIVFENVNSGEIRVATTVEHIAAFFNSSDEGPNSRNKQDFGWRLAPEDLVELERLQADPTVMGQIAQAYQIPPEDVAPYNVLKYMASKRFAAAKQEAELEGKDYESDYQRRVREAREGKQEKSAPTGSTAEEKKAEKERKAAEAKAKKDAEKAAKEAKVNEGGSSTSTNSQEKVENSDDSADNSGNDK